MEQKTVYSGGETEQAVLRGASLGDADAPRRVVVVPWGQVASTAGSFVVDAESGRAVVEAFAAHGTDLPIDYEHQTLGGVYSSPSGQAPAAGWIADLRAVEGEGLVATVNWTADGERLIAAKAYRYLSPVAVIRKSDRKLVALHSVALTNKPAIVGMAALVNRDDDGAERVEPAAPSDSPDVEEQERAVLAQRFGLGGSGDWRAVAVAAVRRLEALEDEAAGREVADLVAAALSTGRLLPTQRAWAEKLAARDADLFAEWLRTAPVLYPPGRTRPPGGGAAQSARAVTAEQARAEYRACRQLQALTSEEAYVADVLRPRDPA